ncbi:MAG TPA: isocitrate/isopropylmalate family dehydrogenase, partial [Candidatus Saccharimonadales bacterium]|nr:isocitrate/isopropylmalate family dehydrogenase [Candidatus Saccharimonadales bacterium]
VITGSIGMLPSASVGEKSSLFEPIHGSFPKAAGKNTANPIGSILSAAMMLAMSFGLEKESQEIYKAVKKVIDEGYGTADITDDKIIGTKELGEKIIEYL